MLRLNSADRDHGNLYGASDVADERNPRTLKTGVTWRLEHSSGNAPRRTGRLCRGRLFDAVYADADRNRTRDRAGFGNANGMRRELDSIRTNGGGDVNAIVHDEPAAGFRLPCDERLSELVETSCRCLRAAQVKRATRPERTHHTLRGGEKIFSSYRR